MFSKYGIFESLQIPKYNITNVLNNSYHPHDCQCIPCMIKLGNKNSISKNIHQNSNGRIPEYLLIDIKNLKCMDLRNLRSSYKYIYMSKGLMKWKSQWSWMKMFTSLTLMIMSCIIISGYIPNSHIVMEPSDYTGYNNSW